MPPSPSIPALAAQLNFALLGVCPAAPVSRAAEFAAWLAAGRHGEMDYLETSFSQRISPQEMFPAARSIIVLGDRYAPRAQRLQSAEPGIDADGQAIGLVARYARGRDYHDTLKNRLHTLADALRAAFPGAKFRSVVDSAPVMERDHAARAGLGWAGRHTLIIHPRLGSWFLLGAILTDLDLPPFENQPATLEFTDHCGTCTRCVDACPTQAIAAPPGRSVDAARCISYLTIEHRSLIDPQLFTPIGQHVFGCDICQAVCPFNSADPDAPPDPVLPQYHSRISRPRAAAGETGTPHGWPLARMLDWTPAARHEGFGNSALKRATLEMFKRNAVIAAANAARDPATPQRERGRLLRRIRRLAADRREPDLVRITAQQVLTIGQPPS
ncbi:tRNA epoxyqueuosine(34) reductase QueG [soil metagenome]